MLTRFNAFLGREEGRVEQVDVVKIGRVIGMKRDSRRVIARINHDAMKALHINEGDIVEIFRKRIITAKAYLTYAN